MQKCLSNDQTIIKDLHGKVNYQLSAREQVRVPVRERQQGPEPPWRERDDAAGGDDAAVQRRRRGSCRYPTHSITHTLIASDKLVFNNQFTYVGGGFFLDYQDVDAVRRQRATSGSDNVADYTAGARASANCLWNTQSLNNRTTGVASRSLLATYQTDAADLGGQDRRHLLPDPQARRRPQPEVRPGLAQGADPDVLALQRRRAGAACSASATAPRAAATVDAVAVARRPGIVPYQASLYRDSLLNNDWWTYNGYIQDSFSRGRLRLNGGLRYDWQQSKYLGGCVPANVLLPRPAAGAVRGRDPERCRRPGGRSSRSATGRRACRRPTICSGTARRRFTPAGRTTTTTKITLANALSGLFTTTTLTWGPNQSSGACSTTAGAPCWNDANGDSLVQANELIGIPTTSSTPVRPAPAS